jgi:hypothetical protein
LQTATAIEGPATVARYASGGHRLGAIAFDGEQSCASGSADDRSAHEGDRQLEGDPDDPLGDEALVRWVAGLTIAFLVKQSSDVGARHGIVSIIVPR